MPLLSIIIPTYNESGNIGLLVSGLRKEFSGIDYEIVFVDDNSPDGTADVIRKLQGYGKAVVLIVRKGKLGLAGAVLEGGKFARGEWVLVMDADLSHPPRIAHGLYDQKKNAELIIGSRNISEKGRKTLPAHRDFISKGAEFLCRPLIGGKVSDPMSGLFMIKRSILLNSPPRIKGYKILLNLIYDNKKIKIAEVPYTVEPRHSGKTKLDSSEIIQYVLDLGRIVFGKRNS